MRNSAETLRVYVISSTPGISKHIVLTVRRTDDGTGSRWLTCDVERGNYLWPSGVMGELTCDDKAEDKFLLLAVGCGVISTVSMRRWLVKSCSQADVQTIYNVRTPQDMIFADEWHNYPVTLAAENSAIEDSIAGRLTRELLTRVPDSASRIVMTYGPVPYMDWVEQEVKALGVTCLFKEEFSILVAEVATSSLKSIGLQLAWESHAPVGTTLLEALKGNSVPVVAACRAGVCGCCKTKMISDEYTANSTMILTDTGIAEGYALACSCHPQGDSVLAQSPDAR